MKELTNRKNVFAIIAVFTAMSFSTLLCPAQRFSAWSAPQNLGPTFNTTASEVCPFIAPDNLSLYFASDRAGGTGGFDLLVSTRANTGGVWGMPANLGTNINSTGGELCPTILPSGLSMYFISNKAGGCGGNDIYVSRRADALSPWGAPVNLEMPEKSGSINVPIFAS